MFYFQFGVAFNDGRIPRRKSARAPDKGIDSWMEEIELRSAFPEVIKICLKIDIVNFRR